ncbi:energy transducer TonB [Arcobacter vandammei]|uniref:energy transducer TonB n=1 Tax=Arcobacter vandammei TaxID=2782243 RepID=UPI0018DF71B2|nr:energy transducer TonB [Arcobacter vandammei]
MSRYKSSFLITSTTYAIVGFLTFFVFANAFTIPEPQKDVTTISLAMVELTQAPPPMPTPPEPTPPEPEPVVEKPTPVKVPDKPKKPKPKKEKPIEKPVEKVVEKVVEAPIVPVEKFSENTAPIQPNIPIAEAPTKRNISSEQAKNLRDAYLARVKAKVEKHKVYPKAAKRLHQTGTVEVNFDVHKKGNVKNVRIAKHSKFEKLDEATMELLISIATFEPIPDELDDELKNKEVWNITIPIVYQIH